jgi:hypothetical protein
MIKLIIVFISIFVILYTGIDMFRQFTKREKWDTIKTASYSALISVLAVLVMVGLVVLF